MARELGREVLRGRGTGGQVQKDRSCLRFAILAVAPADNRALARFVNQRRELELPGRRSAEQACAGAATEASHGPARERPGELGHVGLGVAGAHSERVQLHDLAREILVEPALLPTAHRDELAGAGIGADRLRLVEKHEHRRMLLDGD